MSSEIEKNQHRWSIASIVSALAGVIIAVIWMQNEPGFEALLAIVLGIAASGSFKKISLSPIPDIILAVMISVISIVGVIYLLPKNHAPIISDLYTNCRIIAPGENTTVTVVAIDKDDGASLSYLWSAERGTIIPHDNQSNEVTYIAPPTDIGKGPDIIKVLVQDEHGSYITEETSISIQR